MSSKIKIFLGGYVNVLNAQNINCRALSEHLDKNKFKVFTMLYPITNAHDFKPVKDVIYIQQYKPMSILGWLGFLLGIIAADVAYLPKGDYDRFCRFIAKIFRTKVFITLEGILDEILLSKVSNPKEYVQHFRFYEPNLYSITKYIAEKEHKEKKMCFAPEILYLGVETKDFCKPHKEHDTLKNIIFIGNDPIRKNAIEFLKCAQQNSDIIFHIVGGDKLQNCTIPEYIEKNKLINVVYHGRIDHTHLSLLLSSIDLMYLPSRSEGFPKVILETACAGVPTLCYSDYGANEWITTGKNGFVVKTLEEVNAVIADLKAHPEKLMELSLNAIELGRSFDWALLVKKWEFVIEKIYRE